MKGLRPVWMVARRELKERAKSRTYRITTVILLLIVLGGIVIPQTFGGGDDGTTYDLGLVGENPEELLRTLEVLADTSDARVETRVFDDIAGAESALAAGEVDAVLVDGGEYVTKEPAGSSFFVTGGTGLSALVGGTVQTLRLQEVAASAGVSVDEIAGLLTENPLALRSLEPLDPNRETNTIVSFFGLLLLYVGILSYGAWTLNGVIEEKTNRVVEVLMSALRPHQLMAGKVIGIGLLGIAQLLLIVITAAAAALAVDLVDIPDVSGGLIGSLLLWFVLGFSFFSVAYAAVGALVSRVEEAQSVATPLTMVGVAGYLAAFAVLENPDGVVARITTFLPPTAPFVVPIRHAQDAITGWESALAVVIMVAATYGLIRLAGRVYSGAILSVGARVKLRDAWQSAELEESRRLTR
jgi:ABC-2 type transport system permease protein